MPCRMRLQQDRPGPPREAGRLTLWPQGDPRGLSLSSGRKTSLCKKAKADTQLLLLPPLLTQHSQAATLSLVTMVTNGQMPSPRIGPSAHPTGGCLHGRREAQPQLPEAQKSKAMPKGGTELRLSGHSGQRHCSCSRWLPSPQALALLYRLSLSWGSEGGVGLPS